MYPIFHLGRRFDAMACTNMPVLEFFRDFLRSKAINSKTHAYLCAFVEVHFPLGCID